MAQPLKYKLTEEDFKKMTNSILFHLKETFDNPLTMPEEIKNSPLMEGYFKTYPPEKVEKYLKERYGKYAYVDSTEQQVSGKYMGIYKEAIISVKSAQNLVVIKTLKGVANAISSFVDKLSLKNVLGTTFGDETVMVICPTNLDAIEVADKISSMF